jgi:hypothetical protein
MITARIRIALGIVGLGLLVFATPLSAAESRTWTDTQGRKVTADFGGIQGGNVNLRMENGKIVPFPISRLSEEDQAWLKKKWAATPEAIAGQIDAFVMQGLKKAGRQPNPVTSDSQFVRRVYLEITGTIPTYDQATSFLESKDPGK